LILNVIALSFLEFARLRRAKKKAIAARLLVKSLY